MWDLWVQPRVPFGGRKLKWGIGVNAWWRRITLHSCYENWNKNNDRKIQVKRGYKSMVHDMIFGITTLKIFVLDNLNYMAE